jgi:TetR/AcrR family transcriptional regulator, transcriptional repressor for nem operon
VAGYALSEMTDSPTRARAGKRDRLVTSAADLLHRQGVQATTLAHVAHAADVPLGNVYYYFKTKDDLVQAVIDARADQVRTMLSTLERHATPRARLKALARSWADMREAVAEHGCPFGTLCVELDKREGDLRDNAASLMGLFIDWAQQQFHQLGRLDARDLAGTLLSQVQGGALLTNALRDPRIMTTQVQHVENWLDSLT